MFDDNLEIVCLYINNYFYFQNILVGISYFFLNNLFDRFNKLLLNNANINGIN